MQDLQICITTYVEDIDIDDLQILSDYLQDGFHDFANYIGRNLNTTWKLGRSVHKYEK